MVYTFNALDRDNVFPNPGKDFLKRTVIGLEHSANKLFALVGSKHQLPPVQTQEYIGGEESDSFVAIDEGMIDKQRLEHRSRHFFDVRVVTGLWSKEGAFQKSLIANTVVTAESLDQSFLDSEYFIKRQKLN